MTPGYSAVTISSPGRLGQVLMDIDIGLSEALAVQHGRAFSTYRVKALWDTGATRSVVSTAFADRISLPSVDFTQIHGAGGLQNSRVFLVDFLIPGTNVRINGLSVTEFTGNGRFDALIGMDVITMGDLSITNAGGQTCFSFRLPPDAFHTDYVAMIGSGRDAKAAQDRFRKKQRRR